ncbi:hypothetical protein CAPTEDRAFT_179047 [Capitella teleta]|uniref:G-patch domain-containing protein n=1 Tax=Capitella teleta TaxID=283909 RepID=R7U3A2_CAPTE|nr:hypothetical protein CAPTEDRAFT_179047 [Capitella teleta]|eukprot:ELT98161.1 hypothetical protein CAPTEDRAFT_179047 [Capitella teleta]
MSMLAEPRRKQKICPDPRGLNWSKDEGKYGHKMLERMGWKKGKGLGAKLHGHVDPIAVRKKAAMTGVGFTSQDDDNWIAHQDEFNDLLAQLNAANNDTKESPDQVQKLTSKSETAKGRVHYKKLAEGKDLSLRKTNELECVFGVRKNPKKKSEEEKKSEMKENVAFTTSTTSVHEYFAQKMANLRSRGLSMAPPPTSKEAPKKKKKKKEKKEEMKDNVTVDCEKEEEKVSAGEDETETITKKKKKKKKDQQNLP